MGSRVLLVEADLRRPTLSRQLGIPSGMGLAEVLIGAASMSDAMQSVELERPDGTTVVGVSAPSMCWWPARCCPRTRRS